MKSHTATAVPAETHPVEPKHIAPEAKSLRVLVVDDNDAAACTLGWLVEEMGDTVQVCVDSRVALDMAHDFHPDVVLLDIGMPYKDGLQVAREFRAAPDLDGMKIIAHSAWGDLDTRKGAQDAGFDLHLVKPVDPGVLAGTLDWLRGVPGH